MTPPDVSCNDGVLERSLTTDVEAAVADPTSSSAVPFVRCLCNVYPPGHGSRRALRIDRALCQPLVCPLSSLLLLLYVVQNPALGQTEGTMHIRQTRKLLCHCRHLRMRVELPNFDIVTCDCYHLNLSGVVESLSLRTLPSVAPAVPHHHHRVQSPPPPVRPVHINAQSVCRDSRCMHRSNVFPEHTELMPHARANTS